MIKNKNTWWKSTKSGFRKVGQHGLFDFSSKPQLTSWTILHNLYTIWLLNNLNLVSSRIASHAWRFITKKSKLKIHWPFVTDCVQISRKFKDRLLPSAIAFTADLRFSYLHINRAPKAVNFFDWGHFRVSFFSPRRKKSKTLSICYECSTFCKFYRHHKHLITADRF